MAANMRRPAAKKAEKALTKGVATGKESLLKKGASKLAAIGGAPEKIPGSNQYTKLAKRANQSAVARGKKPEKLTKYGKFSELNAERKVLNKPRGKK
jgi:hypothetical protein